MSVDFIAVYQRFPSFYLYLHLLLGFISTLIITACGSSDPASACKSLDAYCSGQCVELKTSVNDCGACGVQCDDGDRCSEGTCELDCPSEEVDCNGICVNLTTDALHCGGCNLACNGGKLCAGASCACSESTTECSGNCVNLKADRGNCGSCGNICGDSQYCFPNSSGSSNVDVAQCRCSDTLQTACGQSCLDTRSNSTHCGACNNSCEANESCVNSVCLPPLPNCPPSASWANCTDSKFTAGDNTNMIDPIQINMIPFNNYKTTCLTVKVGQTVTIEANSTHPFQRKCSTDSVMEGQDGSSSPVTFTFATPGYYNYQCASHTWMMGNILVVP